MNFINGTPAEDCECRGITENGNGSLMRILPVAYYMYLKARQDSFDEMIIRVTDEFSALTHAHEQSKTGCGIYTMIAMELLKNNGKKEAVSEGLKRACAYYRGAGKHEIESYNRLLDPRFNELPEDRIKSSGYVVDTLEAAIWCILNTENYRDCVLKAVNLGEDTDTVAAVAGGLAGIIYGINGIPSEWIDKIYRKEFIEIICEKFENS